MAGGGEEDGVGKRRLLLPLFSRYFPLFPAPRSPVTFLSSLLSPLQVALRSLLPLLRFSRNRRRAFEPTLKGTCWALSRHLTHELVRLGRSHTQQQQGGQQAEGRGDSVEAEEEDGRLEVLELARLGASCLNFIDVCQCIQGLAAVDIR